MDIETVGVIRTYMTRHGRGPFRGIYPKVLELPEPEPFNDFNVRQGHFREAPLDIPALRWAIRHTPNLDCLAVTHLDKTQYPWPLLVGPDIEDPETFDSTPYEVLYCQNEKALILELESALGLPVRYVSFGPTREDKLAVEEFSRSAI